MKKRYTSEEFKDKEKIRNKKRYKDNPTKHKNSCRKYLEKLKTEAFNIYGNKCACCGENIKEFLTIDHINGGGNKHRKTLGNQQVKLLKTIIQEKDKNKYQILCMNCNWARRFSKICPHKLEHNNK